MDEEEISKLKKAGQIAVQTIEYARSIIKPQMPLLEIAEKIEAHIVQLGAKPAFPINLSINEIAAHSTPQFNDTQVARGLLKADIGCHIDGYVADTAFSIDLESSKENQELIEAAETALEKAAEIIKINSQLKEIGSAISKEINSRGFLPITNLSGHSIGKYDLHAGITIPNYDNSQTLSLQEGLYAIEPFVTLSTATGSVKDGKPSGIYHLENSALPRDSFARSVLQFIKEEYSSLPFCSRWLVKKFGSRALVALRQMEQAKILHQYPQLIEKSGGKVAQAEHTILLTKSEKIITTQ